MVAEGGAPNKILIVNPSAGSVSERDSERLSEAFPDHLLLTVEPGVDVKQLLESTGIGEDAQVVVVGGDGTVGAVARLLAGTKHAFGIIPRGTYNNFARALGIPLDFDAAIKAIQRGRRRQVTLGSVNGHFFLEAAAIGLFGEALALGEAAKDLHYGDALAKLRELVAPRSFEYRLRGDVNRRGRARSLVLANTPFTGARIEVGEGTPQDPYLKLTVAVGQSPLDLLLRLLRAVLPLRPQAPPARNVRRLHVETTPSMQIYADVSEVGRTPADFEAVPDGLIVIF
jgi:diacylglycerol kinase family enzyme